MSKKVIIEKKPAAAVKPIDTGITIAGRTFHFSMEDRISTVLLLFLVYIVYSIRSNFLMIPFERDEGIYSYFGTLVIEGGIPYKDFIEAKFPGIFYFYGFMVSICGDTVKGMHTGFMYLNIFTLLMIYFTSRNLFSPIAGLISATTFAFVSLTANLSGFTVQSEHGVAFFISMGLLFYSLTRLYGKWYYYLLMGIALSCAVMIKTNGIFVALWGGLILLTDYIFTKPKNLKTFIVNAASFSLGGVSVVAILFYIVYTKGAFNEMILWAYEHPKTYISSMPFEEGKKYFEYSRDAIVQNHKFFWVHGLLALAICLLKPIDMKYKIFGFTLLAASMMTIVPGYFFYGHYWIQVVPGLAVVAGLTYHSVIAVIQKYFNLTSVRYKYIYLSIFGILTFNHVSGLKSYYYHPNYERILRTVYGNNPFPESMEIANFINANTKPEDNIILLGSEPQIYFYTHKKCPSRFAYFTALVNNTPYHKEWQREFARDVEKANPKYFVFFNHPFSLLVQPGADQYVFEWANKFITEKYNLIGLVDMIDGQQSSYIWREGLNNYKPVSKNLIYIYERKTDQAPIPAQPQPDAAKQP